MYSLKDFGALIPKAFHKVAWQGARFPGSGHEVDLTKGANCQLYAYEFLRSNGLVVPDLYSDALWLDSLHTRTVPEMARFDLVLMNKTPEPYGAHVGVAIDDRLVLHLSKVNVTPRIEALADLIAPGRYPCLIGFKRCLKSASA